MRRLVYYTRPWIETALARQPSDSGGSSHPPWGSFSLIVQPFLCATPGCSQLSAVHFWRLKNFIENSVVEDRACTRTGLENSELVLHRQLDLKARQVYPSLYCNVNVLILICIYFHIHLLYKTVIRRLNLREVNSAYRDTIVFHKHTWMGSTHCWVSNLSYYSLSYYSS